jgi:hypothetical protein
VYFACPSQFRGNKAGRASAFWVLCCSYKAAMARRGYAAEKEIPPFPYILFGFALILTLYA